MPYKFLDNDPEEIPQERGALEGGIKGLIGGAARFGTNAALSGADLLTGATNLGVGAVNQAAKLLPEKVQRLSPQGKVEFPSLPYPSDIVHKKATEYVPYLKPEGDAEKRFQDFAGDAGTLFNPVKGGVAKALGKAVGLSGSGNLAKFAAEEVGGTSKETGDKIKLGTMLGIGLLGAPKLETYKKQQYDKAASLVPKGTKYKDPTALAKLDKIEADIDKYAFTGKDQVKKALETAKTQFSEGKADFNDVVQARKGANSFYADLQKKGVGRTELKKITDFYRDSLNDAYKSTKSPKLKTALKEAAETSKHADEINRSLRQYEEARAWTNSVVDWGKLLTSVPAFFFGGTVGKVAGLSVLGGIEAAKFGKFVAKNPDVQKAYKDIYKAYASNNKDLAMKAITTIDKKAAFEFPEMIQNRSGKFKFLN